MSSLFVDTHNVVAILEKSDAAEGFDQIIDFLSGSYIHYALTVNLHIYISCIKQFWNTASVKRSGDATRLQALVDKKKIVISEAVIREILQLNDAQGVVRFPNEEIFAGLAQMRYEKPSTKLTFYKAFFSSQWKFLIHTILQSLSAKRTSWNEFSTAMASAVICLSKGQKFDFSKYVFDSLVRNVDSSSKFYMYPRFIQLIIQNQVGDLSTHTTRFISPTLTQKVFANMRRVGKGFSGVETPLFEGMLVVGQPAEEGLVADQVQVDDAAAAAVEENVAEDVSHAAIPSPPPHDIPSPSQEPSSPPHQQHKAGDYTAEGKEVVTTSKLITEVVTTAASQVSAASITIPTASATIPAAKPTIPAIAPTVVTAYIRKRKGVIIRDPEEELPLKTPAETPKVKDKGKGILVETLKPKAAKRRKLSEEAQETEDLKKRLEVVEDEDDDVFVDATPLSSKVPVVDYQIVLIDNKPRIVKDRFSTSKPTNFLDEYLLLTLKTMFKEPDGQDAIWRNQKSVHGLALVKRWKLLTSCGVYVITLSTVQLFLLVERRVNAAK
nr:hypothetical protein [Tanacetum cinerariifolium]